MGVQPVSAAAMLLHLCCPFLHALLRSFVQRQLNVLQGNSPIEPRVSSATHRVHSSGAAACSAVPLPEKRREGRYDNKCGPTSQLDGRLVARSGSLQARACGKAAPWTSEALPKPVQPDCSSSLFSFFLFSCIHVTAFACSVEPRPSVALPASVTTLQPLLLYGPALPPPPDPPTPYPHSHPRPTHPTPIPPTTSSSASKLPSSYRLLHRSRSSAAHRPSGCLHAREAGPGFRTNLRQ